MAPFGRTSQSTLHLLCYLREEISNRHRLDRARERIVIFAFLGPSLRFGLGLRCFVTIVLVEVGFTGPLALVLLVGRFLQSL